MYCPDGRGGATIAEGDGPDEPASDDSPGRLLALSDGVFAIAMTLLALDLRLPGLGTDPSDAQLRHALGDDWNGYLAFVTSFYVVANYWGVHRRAMRAVTTVDNRLISHTLPLLLLVAALPFPASVLAFTALGLFQGMLMAALAAWARARLGLSPHRWRPRLITVDRIAVVSVLLVALPGFVAALGEILGAG